MSETKSARSTSLKLRLPNRYLVSLEFGKAMEDCHMRGFCPVVQQLLSSSSANLCFKPAGTYGICARLTLIAPSDSSKWGASVAGTLDTCFQHTIISTCTALLFYWQCPGACKLTIPKNVRTYLFQTMRSTKVTRSMIVVGFVQDPLWEQELQGNTYGGAAVLCRNHTVSLSKQRPVEVLSPYHIQNPTEEQMKSVNLLKSLQLEVIQKLINVFIVVIRVFSMHSRPHRVASLAD